ncbi:MAG TPA: S9 family peptidase [Thermoprotei archaeon]|nr:S9 family peptidase [Thermoprotei archaeon]
MSDKLDFESLTNLRLVSSPSISPDGGRVLFTVSRMDLDSDKYINNIWLYDVENDTYDAVTQGPHDFCPLWSSRGDRFLFMGRRYIEEGKPGIEIWISNMVGEPRQLIKLEGGASKVEWSRDDKYILVLTRVGELDKDVKYVERIPIWFNGEGFIYNLRRHILLVDSISGEYRQLTDGDINVVDASISPDGKYIAYLVSGEELKPYLIDLHLLNIESGEDITLLKGYTAWNVGWSPDGRNILFVGHERPRGLTSHNRLYLYSLKNDEVKCLTKSLDKNVANTLNCDTRGPSCSPRFKPLDREIYFIVTNGGYTSIYRADYEGEVEEYLKIDKYSIDEFDVSRDLTVFTAMTFDKPKELYIYMDGMYKKVTNFNDMFIKRFSLSSAEHFRFRASDGVDIDGWIMKPLNLDGDKKIPWILYIHGGPKTIFGYSFMEEFQLYINKGYGVVFINPRGSDGYTEEFADIRKHYGERDYQDLMEAVDYVTKKYSFLDSSRIGVAGGSYGGFMTNWIVTHTDKFKAAVTMRSICNWISFYGTTDIGFYFAEDQIGCIPWRDPSKCMEKSPIFYVENVKTPTLIIHSIEDYRCWLDQALEFFTALKMVGVETKMALFPKENHDLSRTGKPKHRVERLKTIVEWFDKYLKAVEEK